MEENNYYDEENSQDDPSIFEDIQSEEYVEETRLIEEALREKALSQARDSNKWGLAIRYIYEGLLSTNYQSFNDNSNTLLHYAVYKQNAEMVKLLISLGANPNLPNVSGQTPLHWAKNNNRENNSETKQHIIDLLVRYGVQADERDKVITPPITAVGDRKRKKGKEKEDDSAQENDSIQQSEQQGYDTSTTKKKLRGDKSIKKEDEETEGKFRQDRSSKIRDILAKPHGEREIDEQRLLKEFLKNPEEVEETLNKYLNSIKLTLADFPVEELTFLQKNGEWRNKFSSIAKDISPAITPKSIVNYVEEIHKNLQSESEEDQAKVYSIIKLIYKLNKSKLNYIIQDVMLSIKDGSFPLPDLMKTISAIKTIHAMQEVAIKVRDVYKNDQLGIIENLKLIEEFIAIMEEDGLPPIREKVIKHEVDRDFTKPRTTQREKKRFAGHLSQIAYTARSWAQGDLLDIEQFTIKVYLNDEGKTLSFHIDVAKPGKLVEVKHWGTNAPLSSYTIEEHSNKSTKGEAFTHSDLGEILNYVIPAIERGKQLQIVLTNPAGKNEKLVTELITLSILFPNGFSIKMPAGTIGDKFINELKSQGLFQNKVKDHGRFIVLRMIKSLSEEHKNSLIATIRDSKDSAGIRPSVSGAPFLISSERHFLLNAKMLLKNTVVSQIKTRQKEIYPRYMRALKNSAQFFNPYASTSASQSPVTSSQLPFSQSSLRPGIGVQPKLSSIVPGPSQLVNIPREIFSDPLTAAAQVQPFPSLGASTSQAPTTSNQQVSPQSFPRSREHSSTGYNSRARVPRPAQPIPIHPFPSSSSHVDNNLQGNNISDKPTLTDLGNGIYRASQLQSSSSFPNYPAAPRSSSGFPGMFPPPSTSTSNARIGDSSSQLITDSTSSNNTIGQETKKTLKRNNSK